MLLPSISWLSRLSSPKLSLFCHQENGLYLRRVAYGEALLLHVAIVFAGKLRLVVLDARQKMTEQAAGLAAIRVPDNAVRCVVREWRLLVELRVADVYVEIRFVRWHEAEIGTAAYAVVEVVEERAVLGVFLTREVKV